MNTLILRPSGALRGRVEIGGAKNAALPILAAVLLCEGDCIIGNLPAIRDVELTLEILLHMGCAVERIDRSTYKINSTHAAVPTKPDPRTEKLRGSSYFLGAGLSRFGKGRIGRIGGCDFGGRPIDQHVKAFSALGATVDVSEGEIYAHAAALRGAAVRFDTVSVGATVNAMLAAVRAEGETTLCHAASEPHVLDLANFLNRCGADIRGAGTDTIRIRGVRRLLGCSYNIIPDMIEAGTYLLAGAATQGVVSACGIPPAHLRPLLLKLRGMGADIDCEENAVTVFAPARLRGAHIRTAPFPGFPTDLQPQMTAVLAVAEGNSLVEETIWRQRFRYITELQKMGADITVTGNAAAIRGGGIHGANVTVPDLRAGAALMIAACAAEGESVLHDAHWIQRGYESLILKMQKLGADIRAID